MKIRERPLIRHYPRPDFAVKNSSTRCRFTTNRDTFAYVAGQVSVYTLVGAGLQRQYEALTLSM